MKRAEKINASLAWLYAQLPEVKCVPGCSACCGPVPMINIEAVAVQAKSPLTRLPDFQGGEKMTPTRPGCLDCAFSTPLGCSIYEARPYACRLFGTTTEHPMMTCPNGATVERPLTRRRVDQLTAIYKGISRAAGASPC